MSSIPSWLYVLIKLAIQFGSPILLNAVKKYVGSLPEEIASLIDDFIESLSNPKKSNSAAKKLAISRLKECNGVGCAPTLKK